MLNSIISLTSTLIVTVVAAFIAQLLYDRFKRPTPHYGFDFEKEIPCRDYVGLSNITVPFDRNLENYIYIENHGDVWLSDISIEVYLGNRKERSNYKRMGITDNLFNLEIEDLPTPLPLEYRLNRPQILPLPKSKEETIDEKTETGFFISKSDMEKLKCLKSIKIRVKYKWNRKEDSDLWIFEFSDKHFFRFDMLSPPIWRKAIFFFKRLL